MGIQVPLPWERLLWRGHAAWLRGRHASYLLTDVRLVRVSRRDTTEFLLDDIGEVRVVRSRLDRLLGTATIVVHSNRERSTLELAGVRRNAQLAAVLELVATDAGARSNHEAIKAALRWEPRERPAARSKALVGAALAMVASFTVAIALHGNTRPPVQPADDPISPRGQKRSPDEIKRFMETDVMPWARQALGPLKGGPGHVTCLTCHGQDAPARGWQMPAVAALPQPDFRDKGWEQVGVVFDAQMRNAIYGYVAESEKQPRAAYMREVVMPGMARVLRRPPYDFTKSYEYNTDHLAFGCYHCHRVK